MEDCGRVVPALVMGALLVLPTGVEAQEVASAEAPSSRIEEIVVTARRRAELLEDTPVSITAIGQSQLQNSTVTGIQQLTQLAPNLQFDEAGGTSSTARVFVRGVGINDTIMTNQPGVGIYVDGVYLARSQGAVLDVVDLAQIEVLRGPQGTLFGKNTAGGALNITTVKPDAELDGYVQLRAGNLDRVDTRAVLNVPILEDKLFTRLAFASFYNEGYTHNVLRDEGWSDRNTLAFQGALRFLPFDGLTIDVTGNWSRNHAKPRGSKCVLVREVATQTLVPTFQESCRRSQALPTFDFEADAPGVADLQTHGVWSTIEWDLGSVGPLDSLSVKSITAWREQSDRTRRDFDGSASGVIHINITGGDRALDGAPFTSEQFSEEVQVHARAFDDRLSAVAGFYYLSDEARELSGTDVFAELPTLLPGSSSIADRSIDNETYAFFGQATFDVTEWLGLTAGVRWTRDRQSYRIFNWEVNSRTERLASDGVPVDQITQDTDDSAVFKAWTPMASLSLRLPEDLRPDYLDHLMGYFTWARGFKGGGFNARTASGFPPDTPPPTFDPEHVDSYEVGLKSIWFDRRLTANVSLFYADYTDQQVLTLRSLPCEDDDDPTCLMILAINDNAADSTVKGAEIEVQALPIEGLAFTWNMGLLDSEFDDFLSTSQIDDSPLQRAGESFNNVPKFTTFLALQYSIPLPDDGPLPGTLTPRVEWYYRSSVHLNGPELESSRQRGVGLLNARLALDFWEGQGQVALWARNLTDEEYRTDSIPVAPLGFDTVYFAPPRTFGAELTYRFG